MRDLLLARAVEEGDGEGRLLSLTDRRRLTREARADSADDAGFVVRRSRLVAADLDAREPFAARARESASRLLPPAWALLVAAFLFGAVVDHVGGGRRVHVLVSPVLGLIAWNLGVYVVLAIAALRRRGGAVALQDEEDEHAEPPWPLHLFAKLRERLWRAGEARHASSRFAALRAAIWSRFFDDWTRASAPLQRARLQRLLHAGAVTFALGVIASLYLRGLVLAYEATWESTFLGPEAVAAVLRFLLAPAAFVLGVEVPGAEHLAAIREAPESAASWIHLWALDAALIVVVPRAVLLLLAARRAKALDAALPFDWAGLPYVLRLSAPERGGGVEAEIWPYSYRPSERAREVLAELLLELLGNRARVRWHDGLEYGKTPPREPLAATATDRGAPTCRVLLFNLAQSPEQEVHGRLAEELRRDAEGAGGEGSLLVCVDEAPYVERMGQDQEAEQRVEERRRSWKRTLREAGLRAVFLRLDPVGPAHLLEAARGGLYPARALEATL